MHKLNKSKKLRAHRTYLGLGLIAAPAVVSGAVLSSSYVFAGDNIVDAINLSLPISCNVSATGMNTHTATVANGTYVDDIGTTTMKIVCNDNGGFSVYATGFTGDVAGGTDSNKLIGTAASGYATIETGTATSAGDPDVSNWAMKLAQDSGDYYLVDFLDYYDYYHAVPSNYTKVVTRLAGTDAGTGANGSTITSTYAAYISKTQPADAYTGKVKYTLVHPHTAPSPATLFLQNTDRIIAAVPNVGDTVTAVDARDGLEYTVGKLEDGNIWLLDNLALNLTAQDASTNINADNTNATATSLNALFHGVTAGGQSGKLAHAAVSSNWNYGSFTDPFVNTDYSSTTVADLSGPTGRFDDDWTFGAYYNYCAASAGSYCYEEYSGVGDATEDICPAGWRMPTGGSNGEYYNLYNAYSGETDQYTAFRTALRAPLAGHYDEESTYYAKRGKEGEFWASTNNSSYSMYKLFTDVEGALYPSSSAERASAISVRCIVKNN